VRESRLNGIGRATAMLALAIVTAVPAGIGSWFGWRAWRAIEWPEGWAWIAMVSLPATATAALSLLWWAGARLALGRRFAI
jgi:ABC-type multidrug transport system permease subunit